MESSNPWGQSAGGGTGTAWGSPSVAPIPCSLEDVMSEQLARDLQIEEEKQNTTSNTRINEDQRGGVEEAEGGVDSDLMLAQKLQRQFDREHEEQLQQEENSGASNDKSKSATGKGKTTKKNTDIDGGAGEAGGGTVSDLMLAQMLQHQFDSEHDEQLRREENKLNGTNKVTLSFDNYRMVHPSLNEEEDEEEEWDIEEEEEVPEKPIKFKKGISGKGKNIITKHDPNLDSKKNMKKVMDLPLEFDTGDIKDSKVRLPAKVYNKLKQHSLSEGKRKLRLHEKKEHSTADMAVDENTRLLLYKLMNNSVLEAVNGVVATGKESIILHAEGGSMNDALVPPECAIKVFKTTLNEFKNRINYIQGDVRFLGDNYKKQNPRRIIKIWAEKEVFNLRRIEKIGIPCPKVVTLKKHVLVMSFIGENGKPAPKLKDAKLNTVDMQLAYDQCIQNIMTLFRKGGLVHGDLSEYNMLWHQDTVYFIDVSQTVDKMHPFAMEYLLRDCANIVKFFKKGGVPNIPTEYELFNQVSGLNLRGEGKDFLAQIEDYEKNEEKLRMQKGKDYPFNYFFTKAEEERLNSKLAEKESEEDDLSSEEEDTSSQEEDESPVTVQSEATSDEQNRGDTMSDIDRCKDSPDTSQRH